MKLTLEQKLVLQQLVKSIRDEYKSQVTLGGYAGTGKTSICKYLINFFPNFAACAYTGKAANVLREKGIPATTIHSRIYEPQIVDGQVEFVLRVNPGCTGFIVDESSMVSKEIYEDMRSYGLPMIFIGDHGQLEPIGADFNLMENPDYKLEQIHRNAGSIAKFSEHIRKGFSPRGFPSDEKVEFLGKRQITDSLLTEVDQVICAFNKTRVETNNRIRKALGLTGVVSIGEKIMCLRNNHTAGLFNGMQGEVVGLSRGKRGTYYMDLEFDGLVYNIHYDQSQFGKDKYDFKFGQSTPNPFDYAYCITTHKSQGSEFNDVLVIEQRCKNWDHRRWAYTAASRAKQKLRWVAA